MSNNMSNNLTNDNGTPNLDNPRVLAAFVDGMGILLTHVVQSIAAGRVLNDEDLLNICTVYKTLQGMRDGVGIDTDWYHDTQHDLIPSIISEGREKVKARNDAIVKAMLDAGLPLELIPPSLRPKPDAATTADALLDSLRADGVIG